MPLALFDSIREQRLSALRNEFLPLLPADRPLTLEIGCGHGHYLNAYAAAHPEEFCIGIDLLADRIERARRKARRAGLANLLFIQAEAGLFLGALSRPRATDPSPETTEALIAEAVPESNAVEPPKIRRVFVLFSDPWPKRRHWKHRVLQNSLLDTLAPLAPKGATLHFRTDHGDYFNFAQGVVENHAEWRLTEPGKPGEPAWPFEHVSVFEERALAGAPQSFTAIRI